MNYILLLIASASLLVNSYALWRILPKSIRRQKSVLLDTSAIMDGRIVEVVKSGFVPEQLIIPRFVIAEMQLLADKADHLKRERARFGLQVVQDLQNSRYTDVVISGEDIKSETGVDEKLVKLAVKRGALLFTTDYNLLKVAEIEGVRVLNINELAQNLRASNIPGEQAEIKIVGKGQEKTQGIGYLEDGTLVVVEKAASHQGKNLKVEFTRNLQTTAGRMMFAKMLEHKPRTNEAALSPVRKNRIPNQPRSVASNRAGNRRPRTAEDKLIAAINDSPEK
ncbi:MAG TPA: hypothetical protein PJ984_00240 [Candidatus Saccharibacteria bacterium]|nr:hypothetical protein [Candidatus Saccharibacteria bacterium]